MRALFLALLLAAFGQPAISQTLWGEARAGMSVAEVRAAYPSAAEFEPSPGALRDDGLMMLFRAPAVEIGKLSVTPSFYFRDGRLAKVALAASDVTDQDADARFDALVEALRAKYGAAVANNVSRSRLGRSGTMTWVSGRTTIEATIFAFNGGKPIIFVWYSARLAELGDKL